ncbi:hypothetical protein CN978_30525 [Priestia megaterium]|nr:hypothetical protein CN978_30525 [Priestia megaterium]PGQ87658.1 hypothetical protein COA18_07455 [Priestia megaterium]
MEGIFHGEKEGSHKSSIFHRVPGKFIMVSRFDDICKKKKAQTCLWFVLFWLKNSNKRKVV